MTRVYTKEGDLELRGFGADLQVPEGAQVSCSRSFGIRCNGYGILTPA